MGRVGDEQVAQETIDESFPENEPPPPAARPRSTVPSNNNTNPPQPNRPPKGEEHEEDLYYVSSQGPTSFPPVNNEYELHDQPAHAFPPPQSNMGMHFAHQPVPQSVPQHGAVPMGRPMMGQPSPAFNANGFVAPPLAQDKAWSSDLFDCMNDPQNALITACFPCITFGQIAEIIDNGNTTCATSGIIYGAIAFCIAIPCIMSCTYRSKMRARFGLIESPAQDWIVHCFCEWCALCQEYRQLQAMGYDPTIGWQGNEARMRGQQNQHFAMTPPTGQRMMM